MKRFVAIAASIFVYFCFAHLVQISQADSKNFEEDNCSSRLLTRGEGCFVYQVKDADLSIPVYYYLPNKLNSNTQIVFAMHGEKRNAKDYRNDWRKIYSSNSDSQPNFILLAPQFAQKDFPGLLYKPKEEDEERADVIELLSSHKFPSLRAIANFEEIGLP